MHMFFGVPAQLQQYCWIKCFQRSFVSKQLGWYQWLWCHSKHSEFQKSSFVPPWRWNFQKHHNHGILSLSLRSTKLLSCRSWTRVRAGRCRWSRCGRCAASACSPWSVRGARLASEPTALLPGSPAESPRSWCSAWPAAGSHSCWVFSRAGVWGWVSAALRRLCWHYVGASAHVCWWTPSLSWYCGTSAKN